MQWCKLTALQNQINLLFGTALLACSFISSNYWLVLPITPTIHFFVIRFLTQLVWLVSDSWFNPTTRDSTRDSDFHFFNDSDSTRTRHLWLATRLVTRPKWLANSSDYYSTTTLCTASTAKRPLPISTHPTAQSQLYILELVYRCWTVKLALLSDKDSPSVCLHDNCTSLM